MLCSNPSCGSEIPEGRLRENPNARLCTKCQEEVEQAVKRPIAPHWRPVSEPVDKDVMAESIVEAQKRIGHERDLGEVRQRLNDPAWLSRAFEAPDVKRLYKRNKKRQEVMAKAITEVGRTRGWAVNLDEIRRRLHDDPEYREKARGDSDVMKIYNTHMRIKPITSADLF